MNFKKITIYTTNISKQFKFYSETLGFPIIQKTKQFLEINCGKSILRMEKSTHTIPSHFAFTIPANQIEKAAEWLNKQVSTITYEGKEIIDFPKWNARSVYFHDADRNIVELISRKNLKNNFFGEFNPMQIVEISEIGIVCESIPTLFQSIRERVPLPIFDGSLDSFCATGDEHGLFIIINRLKKKWFPLQEEAGLSCCKVYFSHEEKNYVLEMIDGRATIQSLD